MKNTMNDTILVIEPDELGTVNGGMMTENQKYTLIRYIMSFVNARRSEHEAFANMSFIVEHTPSFSGVTEEELSELIHTVYERN